MTTKSEEPVWHTTKDDMENTLWFADSPLHDEGCYFQFRIQPKLWGDRIEFADDSDVELGVSRAFPDGTYTTLEEAKQDMQNRADEMRKIVADE